MGIDMKKEIKLSDLLKRGPKEPKAEKPPKEPRQSRFKREKALKEKTVALEPKDGPTLRDIPLMRAFNLLPKEEVRTEKDSARPSAIPHIIVALAGVLVFAALAAFYLSSSASVTKKTGQLDDLRGDLASLQVPEKQPQSSGGSINIDSERAARTSALSTALADRLAWDRILRELALVLPTDVTLVTLDATAPSPGSAGAASAAGASTFRITGHSDSQASVARLLSRLEVVPELRSVQLEFSTTSEDASVPGVNFAITAAVRQGATA